MGVAAGAVLSNWGSAVSSWAKTRCWVGVGWDGAVCAHDFPFMLHCSARAFDISNFDDVSI